MNCHKAINEVAGPESEYTNVTEEYSKEFYDGEIQKLYAKPWAGIRTSRLIQEKHNRSNG
jgi:hypothetical protein